MTFRKLCEYSGWDFKKASDDRANGADFIQTISGGRLICDGDDCAAAIFFTDQRRAGHTVKVAGAAATRLREAMHKYPEADQLTTVELLNGSSFTLPTADLDLASGYTSGAPVRTATMIECRNLRLRVQQAVEADAAIIGGEYE